MSMDASLSFLTEVDDQELEIEFTVYFNSTHITGIKLDTVHKVDRGPSDSTLWTKLSIATLDEATRAHIIKQAELMAQNVCLQVPEREYFSQEDLDHY